MIQALDRHLGDVRDRDVAESDVPASIDLGRCRRGVREQHGTEPALHEERRLKNGVDHPALLETLLDGSLGVAEWSFREALGVE